MKYYPFFQEMGGVEVPLCETLPRQLENASLPKSSAMGLLGKLLNSVSWGGGSWIPKPTNF